MKVSKYGWGGKTMAEHKLVTLSSTYYVMGYLVQWEICAAIY
jgi:uncharacterized membrane protein YciS (DUF1049 family)